MLQNIYISVIYSKYFSFCLQFLLWLLEMADFRGSCHLNIQYASYGLWTAFRCAVWYWDDRVWIFWQWQKSLSLTQVGGMRLERCHSLKTHKTVNKVREGWLSSPPPHASWDSRPHHVMKQMRLFDVNMPGCSIWCMIPLYPCDLFISNPSHLR